MKHNFKIGEISDLYQIGPDSIRYYEKLGILTPKRGENKYRQYSIHDLWRLNVIRDLRKLNFSMDTIKTYLDNRSVETTEHLLNEELTAIEVQIQNLGHMKADVLTRLQVLDEAKYAPMGTITQKELSTRNCYMIHSGYESDSEMDMLIKQLLNIDKQNLHIIGNNRIGSVLSKEAIQKHQYRNYSDVFIIDEHGTSTIKGGTYLSLLYRGDCDQNALYIPKLLEYAKKQNLTPSGPVLELLWIDIHQAEDTAEHVTELQMRVL